MRARRTDAGRRFTGSEAFRGVVRRSHRGRAGRRTRATDDGRSRGVRAHTPPTTTMGRDREAQSIAGESAAGDATSSFRWGGEAEALRTAPVVSAAAGGESPHVGSPAADFEARRWLLRFHQSGGSGGAAARPGDVCLRAPRPRTDHGQTSHLMRRRVGAWWWWVGCGGGGGGCGGARPTRINGTSDTPPDPRKRNFVSVATLALV